MTGPARDVLWVMVVLGIPASAVSLAWWARDAVRWVRRRKASAPPAHTDGAGSGQAGPTPSTSSMRRGGER